MEYINRRYVVKLKEEKVVVKTERTYTLTLTEEEAMALNVALRMNDRRPGYQWRKLLSEKYPKANGVYGILNAFDDIDFVVPKGEEL